MSPDDHQRAGQLAADRAAELRHHGDVSGSTIRTAAQRDQAIQAATDRAAAARRRAAAAATRSAEAHQRAAAAYERLAGLCTVNQASYEQRAARHHEAAARDIALAADRDAADDPPDPLIE